MALAGKSRKGKAVRVKETAAVSHAAEFNFKTTKELKVSKVLIDQIVGQEDAVQVIRKAAKQRRHVLLIGDPGTGKSMMGMAMAELLPKEKLVSIMAFSNPNDENQPLIRVVPAHQGRDILTSAKLEAGKMSKHVNLILVVLLVASLIMPWWAYNHYTAINPILGGIMFLTFSLFGFASMVSFILFLNLGRRIRNVINVPKIVVNNFEQKTAPFYDATGAHAGALLGDVLHDPFQSIIDSKIYVREDQLNAPKETSLKTQLDKLFLKNAKRILRNETGYEAIHLSGNELSVLGEIDGAVATVGVLSANRYDYDGEMITVVTTDGKEITVTPEHKVAVWEGDKVEYAEAKELKEGESLVADTENLVVDEQDIISTYGKHQQEQCKLYYEYQTVKARNSSWGYKRIAKAMGQKIGKTRWWHAGKHIPVPIQTANWLKERELLPLKTDNPKLPLVAKALGATFGDGGIFENLNGIFLSSSEKEAVEEFGRDLEKIFNLDTNENSRIIEGGVYGHSWCYQNTNRNIIRFFLALGAPRGNKTNIELKIPCWITLSEGWEDEFYGSLFGGELGTPIMHKSANHLTSLEVGITGKDGFDKNRRDFFDKVASYLSRKNVSCTSVYAKKFEDNSAIYRLQIGKKFDNVLYFMMNVKLNYCKYKIERLYKALGQWATLKKNKYRELIDRGYGAEHAMKILNLSPNSLYLLLNHFGPKEAAAEAAVA